MRIAILASLVFVAGAATAQVCTPDPAYENELYGVWPDTTTNFAPGRVNEPYAQSLDLIIPQDAGVVVPAYSGVTIDSVVFNGITGLPSGISVACASHTPASCTYLAGQLGCGVIQGTPAQAGVYPLTVQVTGYVYLFNSVQSLPWSFEGYRIVVEDVNSIAEVLAPGLTGVRNVPNPFAARTAIEFHLGAASPVEVKVFNLLGEELWTVHVKGKPGVNRVPFESGDMPEGVYLYKLRSGEATFTGRMVLSR